VPHRAAHRVLLEHRAQLLVLKRQNELGQRSRAGLVHVEDRARDFIALLGARLEAVETEN
jgi:hypothetical protein